MRGSGDLSDTSSSSPRLRRRYAPFSTPGPHAFVGRAVCIGEHIFHHGSVPVDHEHRPTEGRRLLRRCAAGRRARTMRAPIRTRPPGRCPAQGYGSCARGANTAVFAPGSDRRRNSRPDRPPGRRWRGRTARILDARVQVPSRSSIACVIRQMPFSVRRKRRASLSGSSPTSSPSGMVTPRSITTSLSFAPRPICT
jgi:hypothetical protein